MVKIRMVDGKRERKKAREAHWSGDEGGRKGPNTEFGANTEFGQTKELRHCNYKQLQY